MTLQFNNFKQQSIKKKFEKEQNRQILIVTGLSGAGKSSVLRSLEDLGFYCVDNLPVIFLSTFLNLAFKTQTNTLKIALGMDVRESHFLSNFMEEMEKIKAQKDENTKIKILFLEAGENVLMKRFQETRRRHPLISRIKNVFKAIREEKMLLLPIRKRSDVILDTESFNIHDLRKWVQDVFAGSEGREMLVNVISFGFKYGLPADSNLVYDIRFLPNPYFVPELKSLDGRTEDIQNYLFTKNVVIDYWNRLKSFLHYSIQNYYQEGRYFVNIAIGCTGGKHRSVAFVEKLAQQEWKNVKFVIHHRDVKKE